MIVMQDVRAESGTAKVLIFETSPERAALITDRLLDHGIDAAFVDRAEEISRSLKERPCHVLLLNDCLSSSEELLTICGEIRREFAALPEIIFSSDNAKLSLQDCHAVGCSNLLRRALDFNEICDIIERVAQISGKRLYDGKQLRHSNRFGQQMNGLVGMGKGGQELSLRVNEVARGGFYYECESSGANKPTEGALLHFELRLAMFPDYSFKGKGYVSWVRKLPDGRLGVGVEFAMIPQESESLLKAFSDLFKIREFVPSPAFISKVA
jgi:CheY-like chemotaxis protein